MQLFKNIRQNLILFKLHIQLKWFHEQKFYFIAKIIYNSEKDNNLIQYLKSNSCRNNYNLC
ncbi:hypothetical protein HZS_5521 [Henneguya salminicola]|nr:hypothetical protein HZS_5521 [Henneguya salminicola]